MTRDISNKLFWGHLCTANQHITQSDTLSKYKNIVFIQQTQTKSKKTQFHKMAVPKISTTSTNIKLIFRAIFVKRMLQYYEV